MTLSARVSNNIFALSVGAIGYAISYGLAYLEILSHERMLMAMCALKCNHGVGAAGQIQVLQPEIDDAGHTACLGSDDGLHRVHRQLKTQKPCIAGLFHWANLLSCSIKSRGKLAKAKYPMYYHFHCF